MQQNHIDKISDSELIIQYNKCPHLGKISAMLNLPTITVWRRLKALNVKSISKRGGNAKLNAIPLQEILDGLHPHYQTFKLNKRLLSEKVLENICDICKLSDWNDKPIRLHLDHINGDSHDHQLINLRLLCPNCHSQTSTYCGRNK